MLICWCVCVDGVVANGIIMGSDVGVVVGDDV